MKTILTSAQEAEITKLATLGQAGEALAIAAANNNVTIDDIIEISVALGKRKLKEARFAAVPNDVFNLIRLGVDTIPTLTDETLKIVAGSISSTMEKDQFEAMEYTLLGSVMYFAITKEVKDRHLVIL